MVLLVDCHPRGASVHQEHTQHPDSKTSCSENQAASVESRFHELLGHHVQHHRSAGVSRMALGETLEIGKPRSSQGSSAVCGSQLFFVCFFYAPHFPCPRSTSTLVATGPHCASPRHLSSPNTNTESDFRAWLTSFTHCLPGLPLLSQMAVFASLKLNNKYSVYV